MTIGAITITSCSFPSKKKKKNIRVYVFWAMIEGATRPLKQLHTTLNPEGWKIFLNNLLNDQKKARREPQTYRPQRESEHRRLQSFLGKYS